MEKQVLIIYYDGDNIKAAKKDTEYPDSAMPHVHGLPDDNSINAVVMPVDVRKVGKETFVDLSVFINEVEESFSLKIQD